jgi:hypothetical protein
MDWARQWIRHLREDRASAATSLASMSLEATVRRFLTPVFLPWPTHAGVELSSWAALRSLDTRRLLDLDLATRRFYRSAAGDVPGPVLEQLTLPSLDARTREAAIFVIAMHGNGEIRGDILRSIDRYPSRLALAACLIRSADWVDNIRHRATDLAVELIARCDEDDVFSLLPLIFRLYKHERFDGQRFDAALRQGFAPTPDRLARFMRSEHAIIRRWGFEAAMLRREAGDSLLLTTALQDPDPGVAMIAVRYVREMPDPDRRHWLSEALNATHPSVRQTALRDYPPIVPVDVLERCLVDTTAGVRNLAAHLLQNLHGLPAIDVWRRSADAASVPTGAVQALADVAGSEDLALMRSLLRHPNGKARAAAWSGYLKAGGLPGDDEFNAAIGDPSWHVHRALARSVRSDRVIVDDARIRRAWASAPDDAGAAVTHVLEALTERERFDLLVAFEPTTAKEQEWWHVMLAAWVRKTLGWWSPKDYERIGLQALLQRHPDHLSDSLRSRIQKAVET